MADPPDLKCVTAEQVWSFSKSASDDEVCSNESFNSVNERQASDVEFRQSGRRSVHGDPTVEMESTWKGPNMVEADLEDSVAGKSRGNRDVTMQDQLDKEGGDMEGNSQIFSQIPCMENKERSTLPNLQLGPTITELDLPNLGEEMNSHGPCHVHPISALHEVSQSNSGNNIATPLPIIAWPISAISEEEVAHLDFLEAQRPTRSKPIIPMAEAPPLLEHKTHTQATPLPTIKPNPHVKAHPKDKHSRAASKVPLTSLLRSTMSQQPFKQTQPKAKAQRAKALLTKAHKSAKHVQPSGPSLTTVAQSKPPTILRRQSAGDSSSAGTATTFAPTGSSGPKSGVVPMPV